MREIKFRGQTRRKGEKVRLDGTPVEGNWVYGGVKQGKGDFSIIYEDETYDKRVVYTDTLCQYTGLKDKNGKEIYEGDIVKFDEYEYEKLAQSIISDIKWCEELCSLSLVVSKRQGTRGTLGHLLDWNKEVEVIGNIFDNPELLESADKEASQQAHQEVMMPAT